MLLVAGLLSMPLTAEEVQNQASLRDHQLTNQPGYLEAEYIYDQASFPSCHASTIAETPSGLVAAWFGGSDEGEPDVGIWVSRHTGDHWSAPVEVANGIQYQSGEATHRHPCWNPVLFQSNQGSLLLFYKVGPNPEQWWGMLTTSTDGGKTWDQPHRLPEGIDGPVKNKPIVLPGGDLLCGSSTEYDGWRIHLERTSDLGKTWHRIGPLHGGKNAGRENEAIQPSILTHTNNRLQLLCRNHNGRGQILEAWSSDGGATWSDLSETILPNPNSGTDAVTLADGRQLLVYNHTHRGSPFPSGRNMLNVAVSADGTHWQAALLLERQPGEYSYPAVIQSNDGLVHITYTWQRK
jgi:predicted neuraminidase